MKPQSTKVTLPCPVLNGVARHGWLNVRWGKKSAFVQWDYGGFDHCYPQCDRFKYLLEQAGWDRELIRRLIKAGWKLENMDRREMRWCLIRLVPHEIAHWILDTLPGVYEEACVQYHAPYAHEAA